MDLAGRFNISWDRCNCFAAFWSMCAMHAFGNSRLQYNYDDSHIGLLVRPVERHAGDNDCGELVSNQCWCFCTNDLWRIVELRLKESIQRIDSANDHTWWQDEGLNSLVCYPQQGYSHRQSENETDRRMHRHRHDTGFSNCSVVYSFSWYVVMQWFLRVRTL